MPLFAWMRLPSRSSRPPHLSHEAEERRLALAAEQRQLAARLETIIRRTDKQLLSMVERIRRFDGAQTEERVLVLEQATLQRLLERCELMQTDTSELLREWRDWMRGLRQEGVIADRERAELVRSELCVRGVIMDERIPPVSQAETDTVSELRYDPFEEWDQYLGECLEADAAFWHTRTEESQRKGEHGSIVYKNVQRMRQAHGQAKTWRRMQSL